MALRQTWCAYGCQYTCNPTAERVSISVPTSAGRTANTTSPGCTGRLVNRQCCWRLLEQDMSRSFPLRLVCSISIFEYSILTHYASHTAKHFDRDPEANEVLLFSAPPVNVTHSPTPKHSLKYFHFLAMKRMRWM